MRIVIIGAGLAGAQLAKYLINEKHDLSIIESNEERARTVSNRMDCIVICDNGSKINALTEAGLSKADALICVTGSDELNMIICGLASSYFNDNKKLIKIARVRNDDYMHLSGNKTILGIDHFIHPGMEIARSIIRIIDHGVIGNIFSFSDTPYELGSIVISKDSAMDGLSLIDYRNLVKHDSLVTLVERNDQVILPSGSTILKSGDNVHILADRNVLADIYKLAGDVQKPIHKIGIVGGGQMGSLIAEGLLDAGSIINKDDNVLKKQNSLFNALKLNVSKNKNRRVIIMEQDASICKSLSARFPDALILNEDISDESFVNEEEIENMDCLITTTSNSELNIITAVYMKSRGVKRTIALVAGQGHSAIARQLGVDVVIPKQLIVTDSIFSKLMGGGVKEIRSLGDGNIELIEIVVGKNAPVINKPISSFKISRGGLLLLVNRDGGSFIPKGGYIFMEGDRIVLIVKSGSQSEIKNYFNEVR